MLYYVEINYYEFRGEKSLILNACDEREVPVEYHVNQAYHRTYSRELCGWFSGATEEIVRFRALAAFISWLKNHITTIGTTIGYLDEAVKKIEGENKEKFYRANYHKTPYGWSWETEKLSGLESRFDSSEVYADNGTVYVKAVSEAEAIKLAKKKVYGEVYKQKNAFDALLNSCAEAFGE